MLVLALLAVGSIDARPAPCWAPLRPAPAARWLLPRLIVEAGMGPVIAVKLSWRIGDGQRDQPRKPRPGVEKRAGGPRLPGRIEERLAGEEAEAMEMAHRCP